MYINIAICLIVFFLIQMDPSVSISLQSRRLRLISDIMEDYQENVRRAFRLIGCELGISNHILHPSRSEVNSSANVDDWLDRISRVTTDMYSQEVPNSRGRRSDPPYSFNRSPPNIARPSVRRGFVYTQLTEPRDDNQDTGITNEQIADSTQLIQYDSSMNETQCPITWDHFEPGQNVLQIRNCGHIFGQPALMEWFQRHSRCPVCRTSVVQLASSSSSSSFGSSSGINIRGNVSTSGAINQLLSGILSTVNSAANTETGYYESEFAFNVDDLLGAYTQLLGVGTQPSTTSNQVPDTRESDE